MAADAAQSSDKTLVWGCMFPIIASCAQQFPSIAAPPWRAQRPSQDHFINVELAMTSLVIHVMVKATQPKQHTNTNQ